MRKVTAVALGLFFVGFVAMLVSASPSAFSATDRATTAAQPNNTTPQVAAAPTQAPEYHGNTQSKIFHGPTCRYYNCGHCTKIFKTRQEAIDAGYRPCKVCNP